MRLAVLLKPLMLFSMLYSWISSNQLLSLWIKKDCSGKWDDFKFCLKTKTKSSEIADIMIKERQAGKEAVKRSGRNSEEVWEAR
ncbi:unnamed protein product [Mucor hiemalis]